MSLAAALDQMRNKLLAHSDGQRAYAAVLAALGTEFCENILPVGARMPDFIVPDAEGHLVTSQDLLAGGPLLVTFFRGAWCPYCRATMTALQSALPEINATGGRLVSFAPETGGLMLSTKRGSLLDYEYLCDVDCAVALQFGLVMRLPDAYRAALQKAGIDLTVRQGLDGWLVPVPASFIIDRAGMIRARFIDLDFTRRTEPQTLIEGLRGLFPPPVKIGDNQPSWNE